MSRSRGAPSQWESPLQEAFRGLVRGGGSSHDSPKPLEAASPYSTKYGVQPMKKILLGCLLSTAIALPAVAALDAGDAAPDFKAKASMAGKAFDYSLAESLKKGPVVVYFYPSAFTQG